MAFFAYGKGCSVPGSSLFISPEQQTEQPAHQRSDVNTCKISAAGKHCPASWIQRGKKPGFTPPWSRDANSVTAWTTMETVSPCTTRVNRIWGSSRGCSSFSAMRGAMRLTPKKTSRNTKANSIHISRMDWANRP
ncbi:hypothetical protein [Ruminococcus sp.]|uniref:hypothetical protein n=1 Tax=Ruminococcus sp. TaxID=41978 RepID=UPI00399A3A6C